MTVFTEITMMVMVIHEILSKIGEPYLKSNYSKDKSKEGLGLGLFIGKTLLKKILHQSIVEIQKHVMVLSCLLWEE